MILLSIIKLKVKILIIILIFFIFMFFFVLLDSFWKVWKLLVFLFSVIILVFIIIDVILLMCSKLMIFEDGWLEMVGNDGFFVVRGCERRLRVRW